MRPGESVAQVAARTLGSDRAGPELLAFNHLDGTPGGGHPAPAARPRARPGGVRHRLGHAAPSPRPRPAAPGPRPRPGSAAAEGLLGQARYADAAAQADGAWKLLADARRGDLALRGGGRAGRHAPGWRCSRACRCGSRPRGGPARCGPGRRSPSCAARRPGAPSSEAARALASEPPQLLTARGGPEARPRPGAGGGLGPVRFAWKPVPEATGYAFELTGTPDPEPPHRAAHGDAPRPSGRQATSGRCGRCSPTGRWGSPRRGPLQIVPSRIKLEVQEAPWQ